MNKIKVYGVLTGLSVLLLVIGFLISEHAGSFVALVAVVFININALLFTKKFVIKVFSAEKIDENDHVNVQALLKSLAEKANIPLPSLYLIDSEAINGLTVGSSANSTAVLLTKGAVEKLDSTMLSAMMACLVADIRLDNTLANTVATSLVHGVFGFTNLSAWKNVFGIDTSHNDIDEQPFTVGGKIATPTAVFLMRILLSKQNVYAADSLAVSLCEDKISYVQALEFIGAEKNNPMIKEADMHPSTANLFVENPLKDLRLIKHFSYYPSINDRINHIKKHNEAVA